MKPEDFIKEIREDNTSGASELTAKAIQCLKISSNSYQGGDPKEYYKILLEMGRQLVRAQPSMAPLFNAVNVVLLDVKNGLEKRYGIKALRMLTSLRSEEMLAYSGRALEALAQHTGNMIKDGTTVLTHSYSSTITKSLTSAHGGGKDFQVMVTESRPMMEGRRTARILADQGINVTLIADMASFQILDDVDLVLAGCDCICEKGAVNKIGSKGLALAAFQYKIPFYVLTEKSKLLPSRYMKEPIIEEKNPEEILEEPGDVRVRNIYFDFTPFDFITEIITEDGVIKTSDIQTLLQDMEVCEELLP